MNRTFVGLFILLSMLLPAVLAYGAESPVVVIHTLTGYSKGADSVTLDYALHVVNAGKLPLSDVTLALVPSPQFGVQHTTVTVGSLRPRESVDLTVQLVTPIIHDQDRLSQNTLLWAGKYVNAQGNPVQFPLTSRPGGAK